MLNPRNSHDATGELPHLSASTSLSIQRYNKRYKVINEVIPGDEATAAAAAVHHGYSFRTE